MPGDHLAGVSYRMIYSIKALHRPASNHVSWVLDTIADLLTRCKLIFDRDTREYLEIEAEQFRELGCLASARETPTPK